MKFSQFTTSLASDFGFRQFWSRALGRMPEKAFFWESAPVLREFPNETYRFAIKDGTSFFDGSAADPSAFAGKFAHSQDSQDLAVSFSSLRGDARLVAPKPMPCVDKVLQCPPPFGFLPTWCTY